MRPFEQLFPGFVSSCEHLHTALMPAALVMLVFSFAFVFWLNPPHPMEIVRHLVKLFLIVLLITHAQGFINLGQEIMDHFDTENIPARPESVAERFKEKLAQAQNSADAKNESGWKMLLSANFFEATIYALLTLVSWLAVALQFYISLLQKVLLLLCWVLSPLLFACFAIPLVSGLALRHLLRIVGLLTWPLGLALAATITDGLLDLQTDQGIWQNGALGKVEYVLINLLATATIALWILFSSVLAPAVMQRLFAGSPGGSTLISRAAELLTNTALPMFAGAVGRWAAAREMFSRSISDLHPPLINLEPLPSNPIEPSSMRPPNADDPTSANAVRQALDEQDNEPEL